MKLPNHAMGLLIGLVPYVAAAQSGRSGPSPHPAVEIMGFRLGMTRAQADSIVAARGWRPVESTAVGLKMVAGDQEGDGTIASLGPILCGPVGDSTLCALAKEIHLKFGNGGLSGIYVASLSWPLERCMEAWQRYKMMEVMLTSIYGEPAPEPEIKPDVIGPKPPMVDWLFDRGDHGGVQHLLIAHASSDCVSRIEAWIEGTPQ